MNEPTLLIVGAERRPRGRRALFGERAGRRMEIRLTDEQKQDLKSVASAERKDVSAVVRDAINEYVADYRERRVFRPRGPYSPE